MAFLGLFNYAKEGPGVSKDEPKRPAFTRYFQLLFRKFWKLMQVNLLFMVPAVLVAAIMLFLWSGQMQLSLSLAGGTMTIDLWRNYVVPLPLILLFPFLAGLTYVTRNYVREEHAFVFSDFKDAVKSNWKFFLGNGFLCYVIYFFMSLALQYYSHSLSSWFSYIPFALCIFFCIIFVFAQFYLPVMAITFDLKFKQLYKNAIIFAFLGLWRNLLLVVIIGLFLFYGFLISPIIPLLEILFWLFVILMGFSVLMYTVNFAVYPMVEKYMIKPYYQQQDEANHPEAAVEKKKEESIEVLSEVKPIKSEYVYVNGKLIKNEDYRPDDQDFKD